MTFASLEKGCCLWYLCNYNCNVHYVELADFKFSDTHSLYFNMM